jgi:RimJ/RimL family protein N-acetyltransferase
MSEHAISLEGRFVRLDPLQPDDAPGLLKAASSPETFRYFTRSPAPWNAAGMGEYCRHLIDSPSVLPFAVRAKNTGELIGSTTYCDLRPEHLAAEIGWTFYDPLHRGTLANPECKFLLFEHAFSGALFGRPAVRVCLKTDLRNERSQRAIERLGATREGVLRSYTIMPDAHRRDTVFFSVIEGEWPRVRERLLRRLGQPHA